MSKICRVRNCHTIVNARGLCGKHYQRLMKHGNLWPRHVHNENRRGDPIYSAYHAMLQRCYRPQCPGYKWYGARGIKVCARWRGIYGFTHFKEDMGERPPNRSLDRINNDGNYEPSNCRWATPLEQHDNQRLKHTNRSGTEGVSWYKNYGLWVAYLSRYGVRHHLGYFESKDDAVAARLAFEKQIKLREVKDEI